MRPSRKSFVLSVVAAALAALLSLSPRASAANNPRPEEFVGPEDGVIVDADDPAALTAGILTALERRHEFRETEISARVVARFGRTAWRARAMAIYESLVGTRG